MYCPSTHSGGTLIASRDAAFAPAFSPPAEISNSRRWFIVALLFAASCINYIDRSTVSVALPLIAHDLHFGPEIKGVLLSAFFWSYALMQVPIGWAADHFNLRRLYTVMFLIWCVAQGLTGLAAGLGMLIFFRLCLGVGESIYLPGGVKIVSLFFAPKDRGFPTGLFNSGIKAGLTLGVPLTAVLISRFGWRHMFIIVGAGALVWLIPWLAAFPSLLSRPVSGDLASAAAASRSPKRMVSFDRNLLGICLGFFCYDYYFYLFVTWLPDYLMTARHLRLLTAGLYAALPYIVFTIGDPLGGWIADRFIRLGWNATIVRKTIVSVAFLTGLFLIPATHVQSATHAIWLITGASLVGLGSANILVFPQYCAPENEVGVWAGFENFAGNIGGVIAPLATGFLIARTGSYSAGFAIGAVLLIAGIFFTWFILGDLTPRSHA